MKNSQMANIKKRRNLSESDSEAEAESSTESLRFIAIESLANLSPFWIGKVINSRCMFVNSEEKKDVET